MSLVNNKSQEFFVSHENANAKVTASARMFDSIDNNVTALRLCTQQLWLPLVSLTQLVESKVKDLSTFKVTGRSEENSSIMVIVHSVIMPQINRTIKESEEFKCYERKNDEAKDCINSYRCNVTTLACNYE